MRPSLEYLLVCCVACSVTLVLTPIARVLAVQWGAVAKPRDRDIHAVATPRMGGLAMLGGLAAALFIAHRMPTLQYGFEQGPSLDWLLMAGALMCGLGVLDDRYELDSLTKLAGQVAASGVLVVKGGVMMSVIYIPWADSGTISLGEDLGTPLTIFVVVLTVNAVNFIDGLDGLAAGVSAIAAGAFFFYSYHLSSQDQSVAAVPTLLSAILLGSCVGFLPHNFSPARVFMGDSGSMLIGLVLASAAATATTTFDPQAFSSAGGALPLTLPLAIPLVVLAIPFLDLLLAVQRRTRRGLSPFAADKEHLHHRLLELGHSHRRAVLLLYGWSALVAIGGVLFSIRPAGWLLLGLAALAALIALLTLAEPKRLLSRLRPGA